jgi:hypothetical protein
LAAITLSSTVRISDDAVFREIDGEAVVLSLASGIYFGLNAVGTRTWQLIEQLGALDAVRGTLVHEFDVDADAAGRDLINLVAELAARGLVEVE